MKATVTLEKVNPQTAQQWLDTLMEGQRKLRESHVASLCQEIIQGTFKLTPDCILFVKGRLANGQHRLSAVTKANRACDFLVMRSDDEELYRVIDSGIKRTVSDAVGHENGKVMAGIVRLTLEYKHEVLTTLGTRFKRVEGAVVGVVTRTEQIEYTEEHISELDELMDWMMPLYKKQRICTPTMAGALFMIATKEDRPKVREFVTRIYEGSTQDAANDMREKLIRQKLSKAKLPRSYVFGLLIKSFRSYRNGTRLGALKIAETEEYPKL